MSENHSGKENYSRQANASVYLISRPLQAVRLGASGVGHIHFVGEEGLHSTEKLLPCPRFIRLMDRVINSRVLVGWVHSVFDRLYSVTYKAYHHSDSCDAFSFPISQASDK